MSNKTVVEVKMTKENGWYVATSQDLRGLIVCHQNFAQFTQERPECITALYRADHNAEVEVKEIQSTEDCDLSRLVFEAIKKAA